MKPSLFLAAYKQKLSNKPELKFVDTVHDPNEPGAYVQMTTQNPGWSAMFRLAGSYLVDAVNTPVAPLIANSLTEHGFIGTQVNMLYAEVRFQLHFENRTTDQANAMPHNTFRIIVIKQKTPDFGFNNDSSVEENLPEFIYQPIDKKKFKVLMDKMFTVTTGAYSNYGAATVGYQTLASKPKCYKFIIPVKRTVNLETDNRPTWPLNFGIFMTKDTNFNGLISYVSTRWWYRDP